MQGQEGRGEERPEGRVGQDPADIVATELDHDDLQDPEELRARLGIKEDHIKELYEEITTSRLAADEARASREAGEEYIASLESEGQRLKERLGALEEEVRGRRRRREGIDRQVARLERELERKEGEVAHRDHLLERRAEQMATAAKRSEELASRKNLAFQDALRRVDRLERDLEEKEAEISRLGSTVESLKGDLASESDLRGRLASPATRLRAGIDLFNESDQRRSTNTLSRTLGQPEVHVELDAGEEPAVLLTFTWQGVTWQTYAADPGPNVPEPRVYLQSAGEDLSGVESKPPNARVGPGEIVTLGL